MRVYTYGVSVTSKLPEAPIFIDSAYTAMLLNELGMNTAINNMICFVKKCEGKNVRSKNMPAKL